MLWFIVLQYKALPSRLPCGVPQQLLRWWTYLPQPAPRWVRQCAILQPFHTTPLLLRSIFCQHVLGAQDNILGAADNDSNSNNFRNRSRSKGFIANGELHASPPQIGGLFLWKMSSNKCGELRPVFCSVVANGWNPGSTLLRERQRISPEGSVRPHFQEDQEAGYLIPSPATIRKL